MAERDLLIEAFNDCAERMRAGETVEACLRHYPQYAAELRPLLLSVEALTRARTSASESTQAESSARFRFEAALQKDARPRSVIPQFVRYAAAIIATVIIGGALLTALAQSALPGDPLYGVKRAGEQALMALAGSTDADRLNERRISEIQALLAAGRSAEVGFEGEVSAQDGQNWRIGGLDVTVSAETSGAAGVNISDRVRVSAFTTPGGEIVAQGLVLLERGLPPPSPTPEPLPTQAEASATPLTMPTPTAFPSLTPLATATALPAHTPTATRTVGPATPTPSPIGDDQDDDDHDADDEGDDDGDDDHSGG